MNPTTDRPVHSILKFIRRGLSLTLTGLGAVWVILSGIDGAKAPPPTLTPTATFYVSPTEASIYDFLPPQYAALITQPLTVKPFTTWSEYNGSRAWFSGTPKTLNTMPRVQFTDLYGGSVRINVPNSELFNANSIPDYVWSPDSSGNVSPIERIIWSPDAHYFVHEYHSTWQRNNRSRDHWYYSVFGVDGTSLQDFIALPLSADAFTRSRVQWSSDSKVIQFMRGGDERSDGPYILYDLTDRTVIRSIVSDPAKPTWISVPTLRDGKLNVALSDGKQSVNLITDADQAGDILWTPDGSHAAITWSRGKGTDRQAYLTWMNVPGRGDATNTYTIGLEQDMLDIHDVVWIADPDTSDRFRIAYIARQSAIGERLEVRDAASGDLIFAGESRLRIARLQYNARELDTPYRYWFRTTESIGTESYNDSGKHVHSAILPEPIEGLEIFSNPYRFIVWPEIFPSWDGRAFAVLSSPVIRPNRANYDRSLQVIAANGEYAKLVIPKSFPISPPCWSGGSDQVFSFTYDQTARQHVLHVLNVNTRTQVARFPLQLSVYSPDICITP